MAERQLLLRLTCENRAAAILREVGDFLACDSRVKAAFGIPLTPEELRRHGPGFEVRMPGMDLEE